MCIMIAINTNRGQHNTDKKENTMPSKPRSNRIFNPCPLCGCTSKIKFSKQVTKEIKEIYLTCINEECAHFYVAMQTFQRSISLPNSANPANQKTVTSHYHAV